ncbi:type IV secretory system conjugative DNA transfer family protein [Bacillus sp. NP157]|nr:type IV secretory system conjugative DNA transfer family protein [Bacillus sp. NP157]
MCILSSLISIPSLLADAISVTRLASTRPDVPNPAELDLSPEDRARVADLMVDRPDWQISSDGRPVAGLLHQEDFFRGFASPSVPLLFALLPVLAVLTGFALHFSGLTFLAVLLAVASIVAGASLSFALPTKADAVEGWAVAYAAPVIVSQLLSGGLFPLAARFLPAHLLPGVWQWAGGMAMVGVAVAAWTAILCLLQAPKGHKMETCQSVSLTVTLFTGASIIAALLAFSGLTGGWLARHTLSPLALAIPYLAGIALGPWRYVYRYRRSLAMKLLHQGMTYGAGSNHTLHKSFDKLRAAKTRQIQTAVADTSPTFEFGKSLGILAERGSPHAIPKGFPAVISGKAAQQHIFVLGRTGGGKTASFLTPWACDYMQKNGGGLLVLDGKQLLAGEFRGTRGFTAIDEHVQLSPFEGLDVDAICTAILDANVVRTSKSGGGSSDFFIKSAVGLLTVSVKLLFAMRDAEQELRASISNFSNELVSVRKWFITPDCLRRITKALGIWSEQEGKPIEKPAADYIEFIKANHPAFQQRSGFFDAVLAEAMEAERADLENAFQDVQSHGALASETRTGIDANLAVWIAPMFASRALLKWTKSETGGFQPESVCHGARTGLDLPPERFSTAGRIYSALVKGRVTAVMKRRPNDWQERDVTATKVAILEDEAHVLLSPDDLEFSSKCRSWGGILVFATQTLDILFDSIGEESARALLGNFQTRIWFANPNSIATFEDARDAIGQGEVMHWSDPVQTLSLQRTARLAASSPIFDATHPDHDRFSAVVRAGGGGFEMQKLDTQLHLQRHGQVQDGLLNSVVFSKIPLVSTLVKKQEAWVSSTDWHDILGTGRALVQTLRGGEKAHDFVDCPFLAKVPDELLDPTNPQHPDHNPHANQEAA